MEEPTAQESNPQAGPDVPRSRTPRAAFNAPAPATPPNDAETSGTRRRRAAKAAPAVTFQSPQDQDLGPSTGTPSAPRTPPRRRTGSPTSPAASDSAPATPEPVRAPAKAQRKTAARKATGTRATGVPAQPAKAAPEAETPTPQVSAAAPQAEAAAPQAEAVAPQAEAEAAPATPVAATTAPVKRAPRKAAKNTPAKRSERPDAEAPPVVATTGTTMTDAATTATGTTAADMTATGTTSTRYDWAALVGEPQHAPELLALAAVETIGPRADEWARRTREMYPTATARGIARLAVAEFTRRGTIGGALGSMAGTYAPAALLGAGVWTHAELVLHVAAAHGRDATDPARAAELLVLTRVHSGVESAQKAIDAARRPAAETNGRPAAGGDAVSRLGRPLATQIGAWLAVQAVSRAFPGTGVLVATLVSRGAAEGLGVRATAFYQGKQAVRAS
jgi:hypothetical protein